MIKGLVKHWEGTNTKGLIMRRENMSQTEFMKVRVELGNQVFDLDLYTAPSFSRSLVKRHQNVPFAPTNQFNALR